MYTLFSSTSYSPYTQIMSVCLIVYGLCIYIAVVVEEYRGCMFCLYHDST